MSTLCIDKKNSFTTRPSYTSRAPREGIFAALWIPMSENGSLMRPLLSLHLNWLKTTGLHGVLALGSTGEFARLNLQQREEVLSAVIEMAAPLPVIANISSIRFQEVVSLGRAAKRMGAVGVALMPPSFFPLPQKDILEFLLRAADEIDLPFYLYNYPEVTGNRIGLEIISEFSERAQMAGIKQSGSELSYHDELIQLGRKKDFSVFTAADPLLATYLDKGADGCLGGLPNFVPEYMLKVFAACREGHSESVTIISCRLKRIGELLSSLCLPMNVRSGMEARGFNPGALKTIVSSDTLKIYARVRESLHQAFAEWELPPFGPAA